MGHLGLHRLFPKWKLRRSVAAFVIVSAAHAGAQAEDVRWIEVGPESEARILGPLAVNPLRGGVYYLPSIRDGLFKSGDGGRSWQAGGSEVPATAGPLQVDPSTQPPTLYQSPVHSSTDEGATWVEAAGEGLPPGDRRFAIDASTEPSAIYVATPPSFPHEIPMFPGRVFRSTDGGESFQTIDEGTGFPLKLLVDGTVSPAFLYVVFQESIRRTRDGGQSWRSLEIPVREGEAARIFDLELDPSSSPAALFAATRELGIVRSGDEGETWVAAASPQELVNDLALDHTTAPPTLYALFQGMVLRNVRGRGWGAAGSVGLDGIEVQHISLDLKASPARVFAMPGFGEPVRVFELQQQRILYLPQVGAGTQDELRLQTTLILNNVGQDTVAQVDFFDSSGAPLELRLEGRGTGAAFDFELARGVSLTLRSRAEGPLQVGYARVTGGSGLGGTAVFTGSRASSGVVLYEAAVAFSAPLSDFSVPIDTLGDRDMGVALVNLSPDQAAAVNLKLYDQLFQLVAGIQLDLPPGGHLPRFVSELFADSGVDLSEMQGLLTVSAARPVAAVSLRQNVDPSRPFPETVPTLTTFPVIPGRPDQ